MCSAFADGVCFKLGFRNISVLIPKGYALEECIGMYNALISMYALSCLLCPIRRVQLCSQLRWHLIS